MFDNPLQIVETKKVDDCKAAPKKDFGWDAGRDWRMSCREVRTRLGRAAYYIANEEMSPYETRNAIDCLRLLLVRSSDEVAMPVMRTMTALFKQKFSSDPGAIRQASAFVWKIWQRDETTSLRKEAVDHMRDNWSNYWPQRPAEGYIRRSFGVYEPPFREVFMPVQVAKVVQKSKRRARKSPARRQMPAYDYSAPAPL